MQRSVGTTNAQTIRFPRTHGQLLRLTSIIAEPEKFPQLAARQISSSLSAMQKASPDRQLNIGFAPGSTLAPVLGQLATMGTVNRDILQSMVGFKNEMMPFLFTNPEDQYLVFQGNKKVRSFLSTLSANPGNSLTRLWNSTQRHFVDWTNVHYFHLVEYAGISPDSIFSFHDLLDNCFFYKLPQANSIPWDYIHYIDPGSPVSHTKLISQMGGLDMTVLGIGKNGHICYNEPGSELASTIRRVSLSPETIAWKKETDPGLLTNRDAYTLGLYDLFRYSRNTLLLAAGKEKCGAIARLFDENATAKEESVRDFPAHMLRYLNNLTILLDSEAARNIEEKDREVILSVATDTKLARQISHRPGLRQIFRQEDLPKLERALVSRYLGYTTSEKYLNDTFDSLVSFCDTAVKEAATRLLMRYCGRDESGHYREDPRSYLAKSGLAEELEQKILERTLAQSTDDYIKSAQDMLDRAWKDHNCAEKGIDEYLPKAQQRLDRLWSKCAGKTPGGEEVSVNMLIKEATHTMDHFIKKELAALKDRTSSLPKHDCNPIILRRPSVDEVKADMDPEILLDAVKDSADPFVIRALNKLILADTQLTISSKNPFRLPSPSPFETRIALKLLRQPTVDFEMIDEYLQRDLFSLFQTHLAGIKKKIDNDQPYEKLKLGHMFRQIVRTYRFPYIANMIRERKRLLSDAVLCDVLSAAMMPTASRPRSDAAIETIFTHAIQHPDPAVNLPALETVFEVIIDWEKRDRPVAFKAFMPLISKAEDRLRTSKLLFNLLMKAQHGDIVLLGDENSSMTKEEFFEGAKELVIRIASSSERLTEALLEWFNASCADHDIQENHFIPEMISKLSTLRKYLPSLRALGLGPLEKSEIVMRMHNAYKDKPESALAAAVFGIMTIAGNNEHDAATKMTKIRELLTENENKGEDHESK